MSVGKMEFNLELKRLADVFGAKLTSAQQEAYFDHLGPRIKDEKHLQALFRKVVETEGVFPKIATIRKYPSLQPEEGGAFEPNRWITDDCVVRECDGGLVAVEEGGYRTVYRCPRCGRWPNPKHPRAFRGLVTLLSREEIDARRVERLGIVLDAEKRSGLIRDLPPAVWEGLRAEERGCP